MLEPRAGDEEIDYPFIERIMPRSLRLRLVVSFVLLVGVVLLVMTLVLDDLLQDLYIDQASDDLVAETRTIAAVVELAEDRAGSDVDFTALIEGLPESADRRLTLIDADGTVLADTAVESLETLQNHAGREEVQEAASEGTGIATRTSVSVGEPYLYAAMPLNDGSGLILRAAVPLDDVEAVVDRMQRYLLVASLVALLLLAGLAVFVGFRIAGPLEQLRHHAHLVGTGNLDTEVESIPIGEIDDVGHAFNMMTWRLKESLDDLEKANSRLEAVLGGLDDGVVITDSQGEILRMNPAAERMLGTQESRSAGRPFIQAARDHELDALLQSALRGEDHRPVVVQHGLNRRTLQSSATTVAGKAESLGLVVLRDITELRRLEGVRRDFVANVSHELRTPLASIRALVETLESGAVDDEEMTQDFLGRIVHEVDRLTALVEDLMDLARLEAGRGAIRLEAVDTSELLHTAGERLREQVERAQLELAYAIPDALPDVLVDRRRIEQVIINLVHNAIKFTPSGGSIRIGARLAGENVVVYVQDTGIGIAEDEKERLFERFYKSDKARRSDGTGLGLAIAKHIVQSHGGEISVESTQGEGATFSFTLHRAESRSAQALSTS